MTAITVHCLGAFRDLGDSFTVDVDGASVGAIRDAVSRHLLAVNRSDLDGVLKRSIFAEGDELLKDCLLYTSPSPRDVEESRMPSSA